MVKKPLTRNRRNGGRSALVRLQIRYTPDTMMRFFAGIVTPGLNQFAVLLNVISVKTDHRTIFMQQKKIEN